MSDGYGTIGDLAIDHPAAWTHVIDGVFLVRSPLWGPTSIISPAAIYIGTVVVISEGEVLVVDPGLAHHPDAYLLPFLKSKGLEARSIRTIVNSHDHFDHVLGNVRLRQASAAPVAAHPEAASSVPGGVDVPLADGDQLECGGIKFEVLHTPGHSHTAISLWCRQHRLLISGDAIQGNGDYSQGLPILTDIDSYEASLRRLRALAAEHLVTAHLYRYQAAPVLTGVAVAAHIDDSLRWSQLYEEEILRLLRESPEPISRASLHARLVEAHAWHSEEAKLFTLHFLSAWSRPTIEALLSQRVPPDCLSQLADERWPDVGELAESAMNEEPGTTQA
jgi:glyoxylase-like metal-dependent hydrolase (beta-lactamase superfamily II)